MALSDYKGKIGIIIITVSLLLSIGMGYLVSVDKSTTTTTDYEYVTDISGLWDYDKTPQYVTYDTPKNYTGYQEYNATAVSQTETKINTATSESWLTSTTYEGTLPLSGQYDIYFGTTYININDTIVTYKTTDMTEPVTIDNVSHINVLSNKLTIVKNDNTTVDILGDTSKAIYHSISGYDSLGSGEKTLYQLENESAFYFKSTDMVYQIIDDNVTQITPSSTGITAYANGYTGTVSGTVLIDTLSVSLTSTTTTTTTYLNSSTASAYYNISGNHHITFDEIGSSTLTIYGDVGKITVSKSGTYYRIKEYNSDGQSIYTANSILPILTLRCDYGGGYVSFSIENNDFSQSYRADSIVMTKDIGFTTSTVYQLENTYYYKLPSVILSFNNAMQIGVSGATPLGNGYTGTVGESLIWSGVIDVPITTTTTTTETKTNTQNAAQTQYQYGMTVNDVISTSTEYRMYIDDKYIFWHGADVTIYTALTTDEITLTTPMEIDDGVLTITGTSSLYSGSHTYAINLTGDYAYMSPFGDTILTGSTLYRLTGIAYYKTTSDIFMFFNNQITATIGGTEYQHGIYQKNVGDILIWINNLSVVSDTYQTYDYSDLTRTGNNGIGYTSTTQANNYVISSATVTSTITGWSKSEYTGTGTYLTGTYVTIPQRSAIRLTTTDNALWHTSNPVAYMLDDIYDDSTYQNGKYGSSHLMRGMTLGSFLTAIGVSSTATNITLTLSVDNDTVFLATSPNNDWSSTNITFGAVSTYTHVKNDLGDHTLNINLANNTVTTESGTYPVSEYTIYWQTLPSYGSYNTETETSITGTLGGLSGYQSGQDYSGIKYSADIDSVVSTYMVIKDGAYINTASAQKITEWRNIHQNGKVEILFHAKLPNVFYQNQLILSTTDTIKITHYANTETKISFNGGTEKYIGNWNNYIISIDAQKGTVKATPCDIFVNYQQFNRIDYTYDIGTFTPNQEISKILYEYTSSSWGFSVVNTDVFLNTYNSVMKDASLTINDYFTDLGETRVNFYSFALYGNSVTINGHTYYGSASAQSINQTNNIAIPITDSEGHTTYKIHTLTNIYITYSNDGHTYLTFDDEDVTYDLGETVNQTLSFSGNWYFTTGLYKGYMTTESHYQWEVGKLTLRLPAIALIFVGLTVLGYILVKRFTDAEFTIIDYLLIVGALAIAIVLSGGLLND